ncbi:hypothetical protein ScPMuIL_006735 [Solemya velum]
MKKDVLGIFCSLLVIQVVSSASFKTLIGEFPFDDVTENELFDVDIFLKRYGYLEEVPHLYGTRQKFHDETTRSQAIRHFQRFNGLPVTGLLDRVTVRKMKKPRCGVPDIEYGVGDKASPASFTAPGSTWDGDVVSWKQSSFTGQLPRYVQRTALRNALDRWAKVSSLRFQETTGHADIDVQFARGNHGDQIWNAFDGRGGVLAHAFSPKNGNTHFDDDERWVYHTNDGTELESVAAHEFGHALGLGHSDNPNALMAPYYRGYDPTLHQDDIDGIQFLYGGPFNKPTSSRPTTSTTLTTTPTTTTTTTTPPPPPPPTPELCKMEFDAVISGPGAATYVFRKDKIYELDNTGIVLGYPRQIQDVFPGAPTHIGAAVHMQSTEQTYLFKGSRVWRYHRFILDDGYNGNISTTTRMLCRSTFWEYNQYEDNLVLRGFPLRTSLYWQGIPNGIDAIVNWNDGNIYFFKGNVYFKMERSTRVGGAARDIGPAWLGRVCGFAPK